MQGVHECIGLLDIVSASYCCGGIFVSASVVFYITFHLLTDTGFKVFQVLAMNVVYFYFFRHNLMFVSP